jgi:uncharacterized protein
MPTQAAKHTRSDDMKFAEIQDSGANVIEAYGDGRVRINGRDYSRSVAVSERGIGVEVMDTGAACRTYNILVSEGRDVVAALLLD